MEKNGYMKNNNRIKLKIQKSLSEKITLTNGIIILSAFVIMILSAVTINSKLNMRKEKQMMDVYISNSLNSVDNKLKDMGRVSLICFSDTQTQDILRYYDSYTYSKQLESGQYLSKLYTSLISIRDDISGVYIFNSDKLLFYQDSFTSSYRRDYDITQFIQKLEQIEAENENKNIGGCKLVLSKQPEFMRYGTTPIVDEYTENRLYLIREIKNFSPNERIGHILLITNAEVMKEILEKYLDADSFYALITADGSVVCSSNKEEIGTNLQEVSSELNSNIADTQGTFQIGMHDQEYMVSYQTSEYSDMTLLVGKPVKVIVSDAVQFMKVSLLLFIVLVMATILLTSYYTRKMLHPLKELSETMRNFTRGDMQIKVPVVTQDEMGALIASFNKMMDMINDLIELEYESKVRLQEAKLKQKTMSLSYLKNQINSHFLYNTLDTIRIKADINGDADVAYMIMLLVDFFRLGVKAEQQMVTLRQEIKLIQVYLQLMCYRYPHLCCEYDVDDSLNDIKIPNFILQPIVENSIMHGLRPLGYRGKIMLSIQSDTMRKGYVVIKIYDNGVGMSVGTKRLLDYMLTIAEDDIWGESDDGHIGVLNVHRRLKVAYSGDCGLCYQNNLEGGVTVTIVINENVKPEEQKGKK